MQPTLYVNTSAELNHALQLLSGADHVALDTEFMRESTYYPGLCLIQAAAGDHCLVIDPLLVTDLQPLWLFLSDRRRIKVLHAARQDVEVMSQAMSRFELSIAGPIFDTQIAAGLLGYPAQIGYGNLVAERLGHELSKGHARTDWARRPLSAEQLRYAADDVRYLAPLFLDLQAALVSAGRLSWLTQLCAELEDPGLYRTEPTQAWRRLKGLERLQPQQRAAAKLLAGWRETRAMSSDKPRGWILTDETLRELAERLPTEAAALEQIRGLPPAVIRKRGQEILELLAQSAPAAANEEPMRIPPKPEAAKLARVTDLMTFVREQALALNIAPELLATRRDVEQLVFSGRSEHLLSGWRRAVIGERLVALA